MEMGETAQYNITITNSDHPLGVDIRLEVYQNISRYTIDKQTFHLSFLEQERVAITVFTDNIWENDITTIVVYFEKGEEDTEEQNEGDSRFITTITHPTDPGTVRDSSNTNGSFTIIALGGFSLLAVAGAAYYYKHGSLPILTAYSKISKERILDHPLRKEVCDLLQEQGIEGMSLGEIHKSLQDNVSKGTVHHHLRKLCKAGRAFQDREKRYIYRKPLIKSDMEKEQVKAIKARDAQRRYREQNPEKVKERQKMWYLKQKELENGTQR